MRKVKLSDVCDISSGGTPSRNHPAYFKGDIPWTKISDIENAENGVLYETEEHISVEGLKNIRGKLFPKGTLLFAMYGSIGKVAISGRELSTNQAILGIRPRRNDEISLGYLKVWFLSNKQRLINQGRGVALKNLSATIVRDLEIELPSFADQVRIAHLLGKVEHIIAQRKKHLQQLDDLLKSVFLKMFGPSSAGYADWPLVEIKDLAAKHKGAMRTGPFGSNLLHNEFSIDGDVAVLGIDNAVKNRFVWDERRFITVNKYKELESYRIFPGDVIVTIMGTIGRSAVVPDDIPLAINTKHLAAITLNRELANPLFLSYSIHSSPFILNQFRSKNRGAIMSGLNLGIIKETKLKRPPIALQEKFAETHKCVDELRANYLRSLTDLEDLYGALSEQAFKGKLDLSRVSMLDVEKETTMPFQTVEGEQSRTVWLCGIGEILDAVRGPVRHREILRFWLETWCTQLNGAEFSAEGFLAAAQERLAELHPNEDIKLGLDAYDEVKRWVFETLDSCQLKQGYVDLDNRIALAPQSVEWGAW
jgi:type I restriction enzyme S subunit